MNVAPKMHISLGLTLKTQLRVKNSVIQEIQTSASLYEINRKEMTISLAVLRVYMTI